MKKPDVSTQFAPSKTKPIAEKSKEDADSTSPLVKKHLRVRELVCCLIQDAGCNAGQK
jgi:hypothetical protein